MSSHHSVDWTAHIGWFDVTIIPRICRIPRQHVDTPYACRWDEVRQETIARSLGLLQDKNWDGGRCVPDYIA